MLAVHVETVEGLFCVFFLFFEGSGKAFKTQATSWGFERSPRFYLSEEQMLRFT